MRTKTCDCGFRPSLNARSCPRCGEAFFDVAPLPIRNWILDHARRVRDEHPDWDEDRMCRYLRVHLLHDRGLLKALEDEHAHDVRPQPEESLLEELLRWIEAQVSSWAGLPPLREADQLRNAIDGALETLYRAPPSRLRPVTPW